MVTRTPLKLPGQQRYASSRLRSAVIEVQTRLGKPVTFGDISHHPLLLFASIMQGYHDFDVDTVRIWLNAGLSYSAQEAVAAHELAHLAERLDGFPVAGSLLKSPSPADERFFARLNSLVLDDHADRWAISRGFRIDKALKASKLAEVQAALAALPITDKTVDEGDLSLAISYAGLKTRLERYNLFDELDRLWEQHWPLVRTAGLKVAEKLKGIPVVDAASCARALETVAESLGVAVRLYFP